MIYALVSGGKFLHGLYTDPRKAAALIARQDKYGDWDAITALLAAGEAYACWTLIPLSLDCEFKGDIRL
ncbi:MAG: hypothetical protein WC315_00815 [Candidatus Omnitrophota bacterium]|jgi:hypothetical protein